jgi:hypothetical protein
METRVKTLAERADEIEEQMLASLDPIPVKSTLYTMGEHDPKVLRYSSKDPRFANKRFLIGADPRLPALPKKPKLLDFFKLRLGVTQHLLQSANLARKAGHPEKIVLACLLHDIAVSGFIRADHGYWGAQLVEPYVDEEISWAIRAHQALRFFPDESVGYKYPDLYVRFFGADYQPEPYIVEAYERAKKHKWYMTARLICVNDIYAFDPNVSVNLDDFVDVIERNFRQPEEGLGWDDSPSSHMWRTMNWPTRFL